MWKLLNFIFGWDYIHWQNFAGQGVSRVFHDASGQPVYWRYKITSVLDVIEKEEDVTWLTCHPSKFIPPRFYAELKSQQKLEL